MKQLVLGILAHVDAGKTTLSEALLYRTGAIRDLGRVDHKNAHLDTHALERARGITIFSRQARLPLGDTAVTLLDTPGHVDFSAEMERTLQVLDYAVLVISGMDGVQAHTETLWQLLRRYRVPVFVFVTKMDLPGADRAALMADLRAHLSGACVDFTDPDPEQIALCDEAALEQYLDTGALPDETVRALIRSLKLFPCLFGSGLKLTGVDAFLAALERYAAPPEYPAEFGARVFKIMRDAQGNRLTCLKVTGGQLRVRAPLTYFPRGADTPVQEKVNAIRLYSGEKFDAAETVPAGGVCAVQGLTQTYPGQGLGSAAASMPPSLPTASDCRRTWTRARFCRACASSRRRTRSCTSSGTRRCARSMSSSWARCRSRCSKVSSASGSTWTCRSIPAASSIRRRSRRRSRAWAILSPCVTMPRCTCCSSLPSAARA